MKLLIFAVYDNKARSYCAPFFMPNADLAQRLFAEAASDPTHQVAKFPEDFSLFEVGEFDDQTGVVVCLEQQINHGLAAGFVRKSEKGSGKDDAHVSG